jgi:TPR repeat protein
MKKTIFALSAFLLIGCSVKNEFSSVTDKVTEKVSSIVVNSFSKDNQKTSTSTNSNVNVNENINIQGNYFFARPTYVFSKEEVKMAENGCNVGDKGACEVAAIAYYYGNGVKQDIQKSLHYAKKGCEYKNANLCFRLGEEYVKGIIVKKDLNKAKEYYQKACDLNYEEACEKLKSF